jgi:hypothetical protein
MKQKAGLMALVLGISSVYANQLPVVPMTNMTACLVSLKDGQVVAAKYDYSKQVPVSFFYSPTPDQAPILDKTIQPNVDSNIFVSLGSPTTPDPSLSAGYAPSRIDFIYANRSLVAKPPFHWYVVQTSDECWAGQLCLFIGTTNYCENPNFNQEQMSIDTPTITRY